MFDRAGDRSRIACAAILAMAASVGQTVPLSIDDFESGTARWIVNDAHKAASGGRARLCTVVPTTPGAPEGGGNGAALFTFLVAPEGWATASVPVHGADWAKAGVDTLSFWLKGDGSQNNIQVVLAAFGNDGSEWSFSVPVPLKDTKWHQAKLPLTDFRGGGYSVLEKLADVRLLQFAKAKATTPVFCWVDSLQAVPKAGLETDRPGGPPVTLTPGADGPLPTKPDRPDGVGAPAPPPTPGETPDKAITPADTGTKPDEPAPDTNVKPDDATTVTKPDETPEKTTPRVEPPTPPKPPAPPAPKPLQEVECSVDFSKILGRTKLRVGGALGANALSLLKTDAATQAIAAASWHLVRIRTSLLIDSAADLTELDQCCDAIRATRAYPVICVDGTRKGLLSGEELAALAETLVQKLNVELKRNVIFWEVLHQPTVGGLALSLSDAAQTYRLCANKMQTLDSRIRAGGIASAAPFREQLKALLGSARMDFLSFHFYGTHNNSTDDAELIEGAKMGATVDLPDQAVPAEIPALLSVSKSPNAKVFITECALNSIRTETGESRDVRAGGVCGASWLTLLLTRLAAHVDEVLLAGVGDGSWGVLDATGKRLPGYWASYMYNAYVPLKSRICQTLSRDPDLIAFAVRTDTAGNVLLINATPVNRKVTLTATGLGQLDFVRSRRLDVSSPDITFEGRSLKDKQTVWAKGYSVNVVQFIPKRAETAE